jgi:hypothetical protein
MVWENLPIIGMKYDGDGEMRLSVAGKDDQAQDNYMNQHLECCLRLSPQKASYTSNLDLDNRALRVRFYGWVTDAENRKFNRQGEQLTKGFGSYVHTHFFGSSLESVPFDPKFIAGPADKNAINVKPGETAYFVPNPYDMLMASSADPFGSTNRERWYARHKFTHLWQTDWFFQILLHEMEGDPHGLT